MADFDFEELDRVIKEMSDGLTEPEHRLEADDTVKNVPQTQEKTPDSPHESHTEQTSEVKIVKTKAMDVASDKVISTISPEDARAIVMARRKKLAAEINQRMIEERKMHQAAKLRKLAEEASADDNKEVSQQSVEVTDESEPTKKKVELKDEPAVDTSANQSVKALDAEAKKSKSDHELDREASSKSDTTDKSEDKPEVETKAEVESEATIVKSAVEEDKAETETEVKTEVKPETNSSEDAVEEDKAETETEVKTEVKPETNSSEDVKPKSENEKEVAASEKPQEAKQDEKLDDNHKSKLATDDDEDESERQEPDEAEFDEDDQSVKSNRRSVHYSQRLSRHALRQPRPMEEVVTPLAGDSLPDEKPYESPFLEGVKVKKAPLGLAGASNHTKAVTVVSQSDDTSEVKHVHTSNQSKPAKHNVADTKDGFIDSFISDMQTRREQQQMLANHTLPRRPKATLDTMTRTMRTTRHNSSRDDDEDINSPFDDLQLVDKHSRSAWTWIVICLVVLVVLSGVGVYLYLTGNLDHLINSLK